MTWRLLGATAAVFGLLVASPAFAVDIPPEIAGDWVVVSISGLDPAFLELHKPDEIIGKHITVGNNEIALWSDFTGQPGAVTKSSETLDTVAVTSPELRAGHDFPDAHVTMDFYQIGLLSCAEKGRPLTGGCPVLVFARNPATGLVGFVPFNWALAGMKRAGSAQR